MELPVAKYWLMIPWIWIDDYDYIFRSMIKHCISQSENILYTERIFFPYRTTSSRNITNIVDTVVFITMEIIFYKNEEKIECCSGKEFFRRDIGQ